MFIKYEFWLAVLAPRLKCVIYRDINVKRLSIFIAFSEGMGEGKENFHEEKERKSDLFTNEIERVLIVDLLILTPSLTIYF